MLRQRCTPYIEIVLRELQTCDVVSRPSLINAHFTNVSGNRRVSRSRNCGRFESRESRGDYVFRTAVQTSRQVKPLRSAVSLDRLSSFTSAEFRHSRSRSSTLSVFVQPRGDGTRADQLYANIYSHQTAWISDFVRQTDFWPMTNRRLVKRVVPRSINSTVV